MKTSIFLLLFVCGFSAWANVIREQVARASALEHELAFQLSVVDKYDAWRADGLAQVIKISGPAPEYQVNFHAPHSGKLKELFGLTLTVESAEGIIVQVPLEIAIGLKASPNEEVSVQFLLKKDIIARAVLTLRCGSPLAETSYSIRLNDYATERTNP